MRRDQQITCVVESNIYEMSLILMKDQNIPSMSSYIRKLMIQNLIKEGKLTGANLIDALL